MTDDQFARLMEAVTRIAEAAEKQAAAVERGHESSVRANESLDSRGKAAEEANVAIRDRTNLEIEMLKEERERRKEMHQRFHPST